MRINWTIEKKRGNYRPLLHYTMVLEDFEQDLAVFAVNVQSSIPKVDKPGESFCLPDLHERGDLWHPTDYHWLTAPYFKTGQRSDTIRLPFRESGEYPEVERSFKVLREKHELVVKDSYGCQPLKQHGELDLSDETKEAIAATLTRKRLEAFIFPQ